MPLYAAGMLLLFADFVVAGVTITAGEDFIAQKHRVYAMPILCFFAIVALGGIFIIIWGVTHSAVHIFV